VSGRIERTTPAQAVAGVVTAELIARTEAAVAHAHVVQVQEETLAELAAKPCARPGCGHRLDGHGYHGGLSAFRWSSCSSMVLEHILTPAGRLQKYLVPCGCRDFVHG
jgi:hypothetical protein